MSIHAELGRKWMQSRISHLRRAASLPKVLRGFWLMISFNKGVRFAADMAAVPPEIPTAPNLLPSFVLHIHVQPLPWCCPGLYWGGLSRLPLTSERTSSGLLVTPRQPSPYLTGLRAKEMQAYGNLKCTGLQSKFLNDLQKRHLQKRERKNWVSLKECGFWC